uniref:Uncharacterized protein n=1 Tax=Strongyloides venezuelensis TaxID=75913 RepID=A0A0K0FKF0_STRVS
MNQILVHKKKSRLRYFGNENTIEILVKIYGLIYTFGALVVYFFALDNELFYAGVILCLIFIFTCIVYYIGLKKRFTWFLVPLIVLEIATNVIFTLISLVTFMVYIVNRMGLLEMVNFLHNIIVYLCIGCCIILIKDILVFSLIKGYFIIKSKNEHVIILQNESEYVKLSFTSRPTTI